MMTVLEQALFETAVTTRCRSFYGVKVAGITLPGSPCRTVVHPAPLPGVVIFVRGVNSTDERFGTAEKGLCKGLNARLQRNGEQVVYPKESGKLRSMRYTVELTEDGYVRRDLKANALIEPGSDTSPVIHFRWSYKTSSEDVVQEDDTIHNEPANVGGNTLLDEENAWGGGPFVSGVSALPGLLGKDTDSEVLGGLFELQHLQANDRQIYNVPTRHYQTFATWRSAKLVARTRELHCNIFERGCPIIVVCRSQDNMVGLASAYFGANHREFQSLGIADIYVLANPPYSPYGSHPDNLSQFDGAGRITCDARAVGLKGFFNIMCRFQARAQYYSHHAVDQLGFNTYPQNGDTPHATTQDSADHQTREHAFLYYCLHDRVISVPPVQGMGWLGLNDKDVQATGAQDILFQRVRAQTKPGTPYKVGAEPGYRYRYQYDIIDVTPADVGSGWGDTASTFGPRNTNPTFWTPPPDIAGVSFARIQDDSCKSIRGKLVVSVAGVPIQALMWGGQAVRGATSVNVDPVDDWTVLVNIPKVPNNGVVPQAVYLPHGGPRPDEISHLDGVRTMGPFNQHKESASDALNHERSIPERQFDPYAEQRKSGYGNAISEVVMRYNQDAGMRQRARHETCDDDGTVREGVSSAEGDVGKMNAVQHHTLRGTKFGTFEQ